MKVELNDYEIRQISSALKIRGAQDDRKLAERILVAEPTDDGREVEILTRR